MLRPVLTALAVIALFAAVWYLAGDEDAPEPEHSTLPATQRAVDPPPIVDGGAEATSPADEAGGVDPGAPPSPTTEVPAATGSTTAPVTHRLDELPFEQTKGDGFVKIAVIDPRRVEVEAECAPERVFTIDVYATLDGKLEWRAGNDGVATLRANLELGNRDYLNQRHGSRLRSNLDHPIRPVESGANVEVRITWFDLEGRKLEEERYRFAAP